ncbi:MAG: amidohydrolase family protein [Chloroflexi bacterium]|nr:amidohydrolase family protein [Chloroflexota bacterium]
MVTTLVRGRHVLVRAELDGTSRLLSDGAVAVGGDGLILEVGAFQELRSRHRDAEVVGNGRQFLLPGLVNAHHHGRGVTYLQLGQPDGPLETWLHHGWGRRVVDPHVMQLYTLMRQVRSGTTTVLYNQAGGGVDDADAALQAFGQLGVRVAWSMGFRNQCLLIYGDDATFLASLPHDLADGTRKVLASVPTSFDDYLEGTRDIARRHGAARPDAFRAMLSPSGYHWVDEPTLQRIADAAREDGLGVHTHTVESIYERLYAERTHGVTPVRRLQEVGLVGPGVSYAHGVWLTEDDIRILAETGTAVCHNPSSNLRLQNGIAPVLPLLASGVTVALGTDSNGLNDDDDLFQEMALAMRLHRPPGMGGAGITAHQVLHMATRGGAEVTGFGDSIGTLDPGSRADMVLVDWDRVSTPYLDEDLDPLEALVARARGRDVEVVMIDGQIVFRDGEFPGIDDDAVQQEIASQLSTTIPEEVAARRRLAHEITPHVRRFFAGWELPDGASIEPYYRHQSMG